ncbi:MAG TPA: hypothetical protein DIT07_13280 [Sphingobacteriaceae bacterium]|nr:hypothetical protein [Sphingobacteriaceae bacterium]
MRRYSLCLLIILPFGLFAQVNPGPRITALGLTGVAIKDTWSLQANQAGLATQKKFAIATAYESEFLNPELSRQSVLIIYPNKRNVFGLSFQNYGFSAYNEQRLGMAYARNFGNVSAAIDFNYHLIKIQQYGSTQAYSVEAGLQYALNDKLLIGAHLANPNRSTYDHHINAAIPVSIEFGLSYQISDNLLLNNGITKTLNSATDVRGGIEYSMLNWMDLRGGVSVNPFRQYMGIGCKYQNLHFDVAVASHYALGYSPQVALSYEF